MPDVQRPSAAADPHLAVGPWARLTAPGQIHPCAKPAATALRACSCAVGVGVSLTWRRQAQNSAVCDEKNLHNIRRHQQDSPFINRTARAPKPTRVLRCCNIATLGCADRNVQQNRPLRAVGSEERRQMGNRRLRKQEKASADTKASLTSAHITGSSTIGSEQRRPRTSCPTVVRSRRVSPQCRF